MAVVIDTRGGDKEEDGIVLGQDSHRIVCGVPLFVRTLRALGRSGVEHASLLTTNREASAALSKTLARYPAGNINVSIDITDNTDDTSMDTGQHRLLGWALYDRNDLARIGKSAVSKQPIEPLVTVESKTDQKAARTLLFAAIRKSISLDGVIAYYAQRPLSRLVTGALVNTRISANQATLISLAVGLMAAFFAAMGDRLGFALAGLGYFASGIFDCVDGDLARIRLESSRLGEWLDSMTDEANTLSLLTGIGIGLYRGGSDPIWLILCLTGVGLGGLALARQYLELYRLGGTVDTAQFPWFFRDQEDTTVTSASSPLGWVLLVIGYMIRRDFNVTGISLLLIFGLAQIAAGLMAGALIAVAGLTVVHFVLTRSNR